MPKTNNLTKIERQVLWRKYINSGLNQEESNQKVEGVRKYLKNLVVALKSKDTTPEEIDKKFKEEFYKICERLDR